MMLLSDLLSANSILIPLKAIGPESAVMALVDALALPGTPADREALKAAVLAREAAGRFIHDVKEGKFPGPEESY